MENRALSALGVDSHFSLAHARYKTPIVVRDHGLKRAVEGTDWRTGRQNLAVDARHNVWRCDHSANDFHRVGELGSGHRQDGFEYGSNLASLTPYATFAVFEDHRSLGRCDADAVGHGDRELLADIEASAQL